MLNICSCPLPTCLSFCSLFCFFIGSVWIYTRQSTTVIRLYISLKAADRNRVRCIYSPNRFIVLISSRYMKSDTNFSFLYSAKTWRWWTYLLVLHVGGCCLFVLLFYLKFLDLNSEDEIQKCNNILIPITAGDENRQLFLAHYKTGSHAYLLLSLLLFFSRFALFFHLKCLDLFKMEIRFILMRSQPIKKRS